MEGESYLTWIIISNGYIFGSSRLQVFHKKTPVFNFIENETLAQVFSCTIDVIFENIFSVEHIREIASVHCQRR